jgi:hypothetical protein
MSVSEIRTLTILCPKKIAPEKFEIMLWFLNPTKYTSKVIQEDEKSPIKGLPALYPGIERMEKFKNAGQSKDETGKSASLEWLNEKGLSEKADSKILPNWVIHNSESFADVKLESLDIHHLKAVVFGTPSNQEILSKLNDANDENLNVASKILLGDGHQIRTFDLNNSIHSITWDIMRSRLKSAADIAKVCYDAVLKPCDSLGRFIIKVESSTHSDAALIIFKLDAPQHFFNVGHPLKKGLGLPELPELDLEVVVAFRGSRLWPLFDAFYDWFGSNFRWLAESSIHSGYLARHRLLFPIILDEINTIKNKFRNLSIPVEVNLRFAIAGHSQGAGLGTLTAIELAKKFPLSPISLFTYSSPAIYTSSSDDPLLNTQIRHYRFSICKDFVVSEFNFPFFGRLRRHVGSTHITLCKKKANLNYFSAHTGQDYYDTISKLVNDEDGRELIVDC